MAFRKLQAPPGTTIVNIDGAIYEPDENGVVLCNVPDHEARLCGPHIGFVPLADQSSPAQSGPDEETKNYFAAREAVIAAFEAIRRLDEEAQARLREDLLQQGLLDPAGPLRLRPSGAEVSTAASDAPSHAGADGGGSGAAPDPVLEALENRNDLRGAPERSAHANNEPEPGWNRMKVEQLLEWLGTHRVVPAAGTKKEVLIKIAHDTWADPKTDRG